MKAYNIDDVKECIHSLLDRRESELYDEDSNGHWERPDTYFTEDIVTEDSIFWNGYKKGYMDLLEDIDNLIKDCEYIEECCIEVTQ